jgi:hypothetical protein
MGGGAEEIGGERGELKRFDSGSEGSYEAQPKSLVNQEEGPASAKQKGW